MTGFYLLAPVGGDVLICDAPPDGITLALLHAKVSDPVEVVALYRGPRAIDLWCDELGRLRDTVRWNRLLGRMPLAGDLLICASADSDSLPLTREEADFWLPIVESWPRL